MTGYIAGFTQLQRESMMDRFISDIIREYHLAVHHTIVIAAIIFGWVVLAGCVRFGIAIYRRWKGIYPPATSQMEEH